MGNALAAAPVPVANRLVAAMPASELQRILPRLELVRLAPGALLYGPSMPLEHLYFPVSGIVALLYVLDSGISAQIAITGSEGAVGTTLFMGGHNWSARAVVQTEGFAYRIPADALRAEFAAGGALHRLLLVYTQSLMKQMTQTAVCNRHHRLDQQLCRWLLLTVDRLCSMEVRTTQGMIAEMLGVRREGVAVAARNLQKAGVIRYSHGRITVVDRRSLEARACECYKVLKEETERLIAPT